MDVPFEERPSKVQEIGKDCRSPFDYPQQMLTLALVGGNNSKTAPLEAAWGLSGSSRDVTRVPEHG